MKNSAIIIMTLALLCLWTANSFSGEAEVKGALLGAGSGAIIGHIIGGSAESVILGTAIGGVLGVTAVNVHHRGVPVFSPPFFLPHPPPHNRYKSHYREHRYKRHHVRHSPDCRIINKQVYKHGHSYTVTKRICRDDRRFRYDHYDRRDRKWDRHYRY